MTKSKLNESYKLPKAFWQLIKKLELTINQKDKVKAMQKFKLINKNWILFHPNAASPFAVKTSAIKQLQYGYNDKDRNFKIKVFLSMDNCHTLYYEQNEKEIYMSDKKLLEETIYNHIG